MALRYKLGKNILEIPIQINGLDSFSVFEHRYKRNVKYRTVSAKL